jgi:hypothetical protein
MAAHDTWKLGDVVGVKGGGMIVGAEGATSFRILEAFDVTGEAGPVTHFLAVPEGPHAGAAVRPAVFLDLAQCERASG